MKICILTHTFPRYKNDFSAPFMDGVAEGQRLAGNDVFVLTPYTPSFRRKKSHQKYKIITYKYIWPKSFHKLGYSQTLTNDMQVPLVMYMLSPLMHFFGVIALIKLVKKEKIDIVNAHWILPNGFMASIVSFVIGVPVVSTLPGSDVYMAEKKPFQWMAKFATRTSKWVTSNSPQLLKDLARINEPKSISKRNRLQKKFSPIIYGTDPSIFKPRKNKVKELKEKHRIPDNNLVVLGVGRLVAKKGFRYLIEAAPEILKKKKNVTFVVVGEGDQRQELEELARDLKVDSHFRFPGWAKYDDLVHYYNLADIFILPSVRDEEGNLDDQSVSVVEAMACAKPIVTTNFPGYKIIVEEGVNGYLTNEKKPKEIAKALISLVTSKRRREKMGRESRKMVLKKFSWKAIGKQYTNLFNEIVRK